MGMPIRGVIAAVPTPINSFGEPDTVRFLEHIRWALDNGCDGVNVLGTTGEANSLSLAQRRKVMEAAAGNVDPRLLMVGTGTPDLATTIALTRLGSVLGFSASLVLPPYYYKGVTDDGVFAWFARLIEATSDSKIYLYNFPQMTSVPFSDDLTRRLKAEFPECIAGVKDSSGDLAYAANLAKIEGFDVFPSNESAIFQDIEAGFAGCISATVNVSAPLVAQLWNNPADERLAGEIFSRRQVIAAQPLIPAVKYLVGRLHNDRSYERVLPPHVALTDTQMYALDRLELPVV